MPTRPAAYCYGKQRRCPNRAARFGLCADCERARKRNVDAGRPTAAQRGYDTAWYRTQRQYLAAHPYCACDDCLALPEWRRPPATEVDRIDGLGPHGPRGHDWDNLRAMTHDHHSRRTARDQPGGWAAWRTGGGGRSGGGC